MKTITISDEVYDGLINISKEVSTQGNRLTAKPYFFQIREERKIWDTGMNGNMHVFLNVDYEVMGEISIVDIKKYCKEHKIKEPDNLNELPWGGYRAIEDWMKENELTPSSYSIDHEYRNAFFTEKGVRDHIQRNGHHYKNPDDYLTHAFRNPEMEIIFNLFKELITQSTTPNQ